MRLFVLLAGVLAAGSSFQAPAQVFAPGVISNDTWQWRLTFAPDGHTAYFSQSDGFFPATRQATIYRSRLRDGAWSTPEVAPFSGTHADMDPFITRDGNWLYFSSIRPQGGVERADLDLWRVEKRGAGWGEPERLGPEVNTDADELYASVASDGTLYFASGPAAPARRRLPHGSSTRRSRLTARC